MDDTDFLGRLQQIELKLEKVFGLLDELMRDQVQVEKATEKLEKRVRVIEAWLAAEDEKLKPAAKDSTE